ncbi:acyltransferase [uncultured Draconibacterium sp.]|uniref:acyltransferase n=1 Tax=uncultured Draconibacterium sp. TaxID=1573823 RepID=UPI0029C991E8|nr:acyltransferase [uncultured Draconibacterium sp.]
MKKLQLKNYAHYCHEIIKKLIIVRYYIPNIVKLKWWGINFSPKIKFDGPIIIRRLPSTKITIGEGCYFSMSSRHNVFGINHPCIIATKNKNASLTIGNNCGFSGTTIGSFKSIIIGNNVRAGANTTITDGDGHLDDPRTSNPQAVVIKNNVWLGANSLVLKGVTIGENSIIGANSVVTKFIPANVIAAGNPCVVLKEINPSKATNNSAIQLIVETIEEASF